jgi:integrase
MAKVLGGTIEKRFGPRGKKWLARPTLPGAEGTSKRGKGQVFDSEQEAKKWLAEQALLRDKGIVINAGKLTLGQYVEQWLKSLRHAGLEPSTIRSYADNLRKHVLPSLGHRPLAKLGALEIQQLYGKLLDGELTGKPLAPKTVNMVHCALHRALKDAVNWDLIARNPTERAKAPRPQKRKVKVWTGTQTARFLAVADADEYAALWRLALHTGMRRGELLGLKWDYVDLDKGIVKVQENRKRGERGRFYDGKMKTPSGRRSFPLSDEMVGMLKRHRAHQLEQRLAAGPAYEIASDGGYVFAQPSGLPLHPNTVRLRYKRLITAADVPDKRVHDMRHVHGTLSIENGEPVKQVSERLGHSSIAITLDLYTHPTDERKREDANRFDAFLKAARDNTGQ